MDTAKIKEIISIFESSTLSSMHLEADDMKITLKKEGSAAVSAPLSISVPTPEAAVPVLEQPAQPAAQGDAVRSPLVGTFYAAPGAGAKPYVEVGSTVKEGRYPLYHRGDESDERDPRAAGRRDQGNQG